MTAIGARSAHRWPPIGAAHYATTSPGSPKTWPTVWRTTSGPRPSSGTCSSPTGLQTTHLGLGRTGSVKVVKVAQVCPYSLTMPGGVQGQVLGLARSLRSLGHEIRVLGPCDGPPPASFVTPLGRSIPTAANGSVAPIAPDPSCALRTIRALRDEDFDVVHLHEPLVPGPTMTTLLVTDTPSLGTFHRAGASQ